MPRNYKGQWIEVGWMNRGQLRRYLIKKGIRFKEERGVLTSVFEIQEDAHDWTMLKHEIESF